MFRRAAIYGRGKAPDLPFQATNTCIVGLATNYCSCSTMARNGRNTRIMHGRYLLSDEAGERPQSRGSNVVTRVKNISPMLTERAKKADGACPARCPRSNQRGCYAGPATWCKTTTLPAHPSFVPFPERPRRLFPACFFALCVKVLHLDTLLPSVGYFDKYIGTGTWETLSGCTLTDRPTDLLLSSSASSEVSSSPSPLSP